MTTVWARDAGSAAWRRVYEGLISSHLLLCYLLMSLFLLIFFTNSFFLILFAFKLPHQVVHQSEVRMPGSSSPRRCHHLPITSLEAHPYSQLTLTISRSGVCSCVPHNSAEELTIWLYPFFLVGFQFTHCNRGVHIFSS